MALRDALVEAAADRGAFARRKLGRRLREHVAAHHSAESWAAGILAAAGRA